MNFYQGKFFLSFNCLIFKNRKYRLDVIYYATKQVLTVLARSFLIQGIDVWKWYNELPIAQLKNVCNPIKGNILGPFSCLNDSIDDEKRKSFSDILQNALKLQDLNNQDIVTKRSKIICCGSINCLNWNCDVFWNRFNFDHCLSTELTRLRKKLDLDI